jgi:hypothetical protein
MLLGIVQSGVWNSVLLGIGSRSEPDGLSVCVKNVAVDLYNSQIKRFLVQLDEKKRHILVCKKSTTFYKKSTTRLFWVKKMSTLGFRCGNNWQTILIPLVYMLYHNLVPIHLSLAFLQFPIIILMRIQKMNYWILLVNLSLITARFMESETLPTINITLKYHKLIPSTNNNIINAGYYLVIIYNLKYQGDKYMNYSLGYKINQWNNWYTPQWI